ncbi:MULTISPECIES: N-acetylmuramoyl-L-alanine amidase [unclassified Rhodanobacter]|uniref:N-acetylmuramoyl-L-alanine amidase n=1 Tax=unclassified Rhodanobacter TaxID=2621553 RepID=UPI001BDF7F19|nr:MULTISPECIES: N-acetylmuramoyl-L-alanine amidase [unclassified Rhodanobacter]MBT2144717.1 N-acetylmuramoyl-L-alanine amidase [Rhodanobacter sp. LX-99]MBT2148762.1 N-acetylmuramoyl-L-alanine amidase [Rhodanobacter sp. LX-100]
MRGYLNSWGGWVGVAILAAMPLCAAQAAELKGARVWAGPEYTRVVLDASGPLRYTISQKDGQVVVDLPDSRAVRSFSSPAAQGLYRGMSHARIGDGMQLTAKVAPASRLKSFVLKPASGTDYRLVLDLYPASTSVAAAAPAEAAPVVQAPAAVPSYSNPTHSRRVAAEQAAAMLNGQRQVVVAIDAGHGGKDQGAHGPGGTLEKNVTLAVARDLAAQINRQPGMKAVLTRDSDFYIPLKQRYQIAREHNADLFVSIHADAFTSDDARGSSVWVLSPRGKTSEAARWLADRENRADLIGGTTLDDKDDSLAKVLLDLQQGWAMQASDVVAGNVLKALAQLGPTHRGYVERANFVVLRSPDVPSILVETAFISNPAEERRLRDPAHQKKLAEAVMGGVRNYFESTPPPGTWFAAEAARRNGVQLASSSDSGAGKTVASRAETHARDVHKVGRGESLSSIARQYGVSVGALKNANQISSNTVRAGTTLTIPAG